MIFVMTERLPGRVTHSKGRGRRDVFQVLMLHHSGCIIRPRVVTGCHGRVATQCRGHKDMWSAPTSLRQPPGPPRRPASHPCSLLWAVSVGKLSQQGLTLNPLVSRNKLVHFIFSVCFNLPGNVNFAPSNLPMSRWQPNTLWHHVSSITMMMATKIAHASAISFPKLNAVYNF